MQLILQVGGHGMLGALCESGLKGLGVLTLLLLESAAKLPFGSHVPFGGITNLDEASHAKLQLFVSKLALLNVLADNH